MTTIFNDFESRVKEVELYFGLLESITEKNATLKKPGSNRTKRIDADLIKVLKANCFLLLYNLMESSISQSLQHLNDRITDEKKKYGEVKREIKQIWLQHKYRNFKEKSSKTIFDILTSIEEEVINLSGFKGVPISGSLDARKIREIAVFFGFSEKVHHTAGDGTKLYQVRANRNHLAHGEKSFSECGRTYTYPELRIIKNQVIRFMRQILKNIQLYLDGGLFFK
ncbi:hypothetical protein SAMN05428949_3889 [Chitinophaga sp. YR627]|uniref:MAE_28990/MAE_18760 family HEPN-like nuclease n=1 Tax=Chitinophaga sp. YR627 TaxID=1881041 RepID=UPI0008F28825|nr:MAE_28990/MAE_18760 family HEPN-like nuclease [Chitinophaga sp. YR627]SFN93098.1 hypothetical protein SAMN05428949_3889 [Chitinophaga sp. YR627]